MLRKISHIGLIVLLLVSTMSMTIDLHYCQHKLYDFGIFRQAHSCCMPSQNQPFEKTNHCNLHHHQKKGNCQDKTVHLKPVDNFVVSAFLFDFDHLHLIQIFDFQPIFADIFHVSGGQKIEAPPWKISPPGIQVTLSLLQTYIL
jgi:hypothetical protein